MFRRPTLEEKERADLQALYRRVLELEADFPYSVDGVAKLILRQLPESVPPKVEAAVQELVTKLLEQEHCFVTVRRDLDVGSYGLVEATHLRSLLLERERFQKHRVELVFKLCEGLLRAVHEPLEELPDIEDPTPFTIPLAYAIDAKKHVDELFRHVLGGGYIEDGILKQAALTLRRNLNVASGRDPSDTQSKRPLKYPRESSLPTGELCETYLADTPFLDLYRLPVPLKLTREDRFNHMHIVGGTGAGKTTLIENLVLHDLRSPDPPSMVIVDPHGDLIKKLTSRDLGISDRLIVIDPRDIEHPPALNVFALNQERIGEYDAVTREQVTAGVIQTFDYLFSGLVGADLTAKQGVFFRYVARLMLSLPETLGRNATILDMLMLMTDDTPYLPAIRQLPDIPRSFFERDFNSKTFSQTKEQIRYRLQAILENPTMARLFTSPETKVDIFSELNRGSIILVDTAKDFLKGASANFGRIFISLVLQAVLERAAIPQQARKDTFLIVDEAASFFDSQIDDLLTEVRKYRCGLVLAHQYLDQATGALRSSLAANTGIKFASGLSASDARVMAPDMRTTQDFILGQPRLQFAAHIRNVTPNAVSIPVTPGVFDQLPALTPEERAWLWDRNRERVSLPPELPRLASGGPEHGTLERKPAVTSQLPDEDISSEW